MLCLVLSRNSSAKWEGELIKPSVFIKQKASAPDLVYMNAEVVSGEMIAVKGQAMPARAQTASHVSPSFQV